MRLQLFGAVAELEHALRTGRADAIINQLLEKVIEHTITHFATEERLMEECGFPGLDAHRHDHKELSQKLTMFNQHALLAERFVRFSVYPQSVPQPGATK